MSGWLGARPLESLATASVDDRTARLWDLESGEQRLCLTHPGPVYGVAFNPNGQSVATTCADNLLHLWNTQNGAALQISPVRHRARYPGPHPQFSPDGTRILTLSDEQTVCLWNAGTGEARGQPLRHPRAVSRFSFSRDGRRIVTLAADGRARVWNAFEGSLVGELGDDGAVNATAYSSDGRTIAVGGENHELQLRELDSLSATAEPLQHRDAVEAVAFSPEGDRLAVGCRDRTVELWDVASRTELIHGERRRPRPSVGPDGG